MKNCYNTLGIQSTATAQEITAAYQQLASKTTAANLIEVKKAYEVLKDNASKNHYDTYLTDEYHLHNAVYFGDGKGVARYIA